MLDEAWCAKTFPLSAGEAVKPLVKGDFSHAAVEDAHPGEMLSTSPLGFRGKVRLVFYATKGKARFRMRYERMKDYPDREPQGTISLCAIGTARPARKVAEMSFVKPDGVFSVDVPTSGFWALQAKITEHAKLTVVAADVPVAVDCSDGPQQFVYSTGEGCLFVPKGGRPELFVTADPGEYIGWSVRDGSGCVRLENPSFGGGVERFLADSPDRAGGFWSIRFAAPTSGLLRKYYLHIRNVPGYLFLSPERRWRF